MVKSSIAQLIGATVFQFAVSIVDPSILTQPLAPADPTLKPGAVTTVTAPAPSGKSVSAPERSGQLPGTAGALQQGANQPCCRRDVLHLGD
jgi:hypothetical protein